MHLQTEGSEAKKELAPEYVENQKSVDTALLGSLSDDLKVGIRVPLGTYCSVGTLLHWGSVWMLQGIAEESKGVAHVSLGLVKRSGFCASGVP